MEIKEMSQDRHKSDVPLRLYRALFLIETVLSLCNVCSEPSG